jgi:hypothetical protein
VAAERKQVEQWVEGRPGLEERKLETAMRAAKLDAQRVDSDTKQDEAFVKKHLLECDLL